jgi:EmrB/QacA subfamily drug resistance transporter
MPAAKPLTHAQARTIILGLMLGMFLAALNQTIVATALPTIGREFADFENLSWVVTSYLLTSTAVAPLYGKFSDMYGRRATMLTAIGIFVAGSAACAVAPNMVSLVLGRALQGLGGGGILPVAQAVIADTIAPRERGRWQAYMGAVWVSAGVGGPVIGGFASEHLHWSAIFWLNVPLGLAAAYFCNRTLRRLPRHERPHRLDLIGAALMIASAIPLLLALTWGGTRYAWGSPQVVGLLAVSALLSVLFAIRLTRAPEPFLPLPVLGNQVMRWGTVATSCAMGTSIGLTIFIPLYFELVHKLSAGDAGLALIPLVITTPGSLLAGRVMLHMRRYKWISLVGLSFGIAASMVLVLKPHLSLVSVITLLSVVSMSIGTVYPVATVSIQNAVPRHQVGVAMGAMNFFRALASALIVAAMGATILAGLGAAPGRGGSLATLGPAASALGPEVANVFSWVFGTAGLCLAIGFLAIAMMEERPLRESAEVAAIPANGPAE